MGRSVGRWASRRRPGLGHAMSLICIGATAADAGDGDGPELTPPSEMVIISKPIKPTQTPAPAQPVPSTTRPRATLALPGITSPANRTPVVAEPPRPKAGPTLEGPALDAPLEMGSVPESAPLGPGTNAARTGRTMVLESGPIEELPPLGGTSTKDGSTAKKPYPPPAPVQAPARRSRLFGLLGPAPAPVRSAAPGRSVAADSLSTDDPAAESALKRRIERQARDVVGNRARSVEVRLDGKDATIHVSGTKLFQKRPLRKQLEAIPALTGLRPTIAIDD